MAKKRQALGDDVHIFLKKRKMNDSQKGNNRSKTNTTTQLEDHLVRDTQPYQRKYFLLPNSFRKRFGTGNNLRQFWIQE